MSTKKNAPPKKAAAKKSAPTKKNDLKGRNSRTSGKAILPGQYFTLLYEKDVMISDLQKTNQTLQRQFLDAKLEATLSKRRNSEKDTFDSVLNRELPILTDRELSGSQEKANRDNTGRGIITEKGDNNSKLGDLTTRLISAVENNVRIRKILCEIENALHDKFDIPLAEDDPKATDTGKHSPLSLSITLITQQQNIGPRIENILNSITKTL
jgi:hypothetical protein